MEIRNVDPLVDLAFDLTDGAAPDSVLDGGAEFMDSVVNRGFDAAEEEKESCVLSTSSPQRRIGEPVSGAPVPPREEL